MRSMKILSNLKTYFHFEPGYPKFDIPKSEMHKLQRYQPPPRVYLIEGKKDELKHRRVINYILNQKVVGFDTESRTGFINGDRNGSEADASVFPPSVVQLSTEENAIIWKIGGTRLTTGLREILRSDVKKVGHGSYEDAAKLLKFYYVDTNNLVDTLPAAKKYAFPHLGLQQLVSFFLGKYLSKGKQLSDWGRRELTDLQIKYAASDAKASLEVYYAMEQYNKSQGNPPLSVIGSTLDLLKSSAKVSTACAMHQIYMLAEEKRQLLNLLKNQQSLSTQLMKELRVLRGSLGMVDMLHKELEMLQEEASKPASVNTPYYKHIVNLRGHLGGRDIQKQVIHLEEETDSPMEEVDLEEELEEESLVEEELNDSVENKDIVTEGASALHGEPIHEDTDLEGTGLKEDDEQSKMDPKDSNLENEKLRVTEEKSKPNTSKKEGSILFKWLTGEK